MKAVRTSSALASQLSTSTCSRAAIASRPPFSYQRRSFLPNPFASGQLQTLTASRILPYDAATLYSIIADVSSYHQFLPFCQSSNITKYSSPDSDGKEWPEEAELVIGFQDVMRESFYSRVYCAPKEYIVESVSGETETSLASDTITHHSARQPSEKARNATVLTQLRSRWTLRPFPYKPGPLGTNERPQEVTSKIPSRQQTEVNLSIDYQFANPIYTTLSAAAAPKVAEKMIGAFETRVKSVLDGPSMGGTAKRAGAMEGVFKKESP